MPPSTAESPPDRIPELEVVPPPAIPAEASPEPAPPVTLTEEIDRFGHVALSVANRSEGSARVALGVVLEREVAGGAFARAEDLGTFELAPSGGDGACADLLSGAELRERWGCMRGDQRGEGHRTCTPAAGGRYRFVATSCDGRSRTEGAAFAYP